MFDNPLKFWKDKDFLTKSLEEFKGMLTKAEELFSTICRRLIHNEEIENLGQLVYEEDKKINNAERVIRKRVAEHLLIQPSVDTAACLLLMSVVKDAERLGDYCKNLYGVVNLLEKPIDRVSYDSFFGGIDEDVVEMFKQTKGAFIDSDEAKANSSWEYEAKIVKKCDQIIEKASKSTLSVNEAVSFALIARYYKRLAAHLANIATSVIVPLDELDYFDEKRK
ncbi:MAG: PhoU domain-containing protein [Candidatus Omnitrophota bacterium]